MLRTAALAAWISFAAMAQAAPAAEDASPPTVYDAVFAPLKGREAQFGRNGPVGPYYPIDALDRGLRGAAVIDCRVENAGHLQDCKVIKEEPEGVHFGDAALVMARRGHVTVGPEAPVGAVVHVRVIFDPSMPRPTRQGEHRASSAAP